MKVKRLRRSQNTSKAPWITIVISKAPALTAMEPRHVVACSSGSISHTWISHNSRFNPAVFWSGHLATYYLYCSSFYLPRRDGSRSWACPLRGGERTCGGAANALPTHKCDVTERTDARAARLTVAFVFDCACFLSSQPHRYYKNARQWWLTYWYYVTPRKMEWNHWWMKIKYRPM